MKINMNAWYMKYFNLYKTYFKDKKEINLCCLFWSYLLSLVLFLFIALEIILVIDSMRYKILNNLPFFNSEISFKFSNRNIASLFLILGMGIFIVFLPQICYWISEKIYKTWGFRTCPIFQNEIKTKELGGAKK